MSVVLPVHNGERYLAQAVESTLGQDVESLELIVVDDASTDGSAAILRRYGDSVRYLRVDKQESSIAATNVGLREARGDYVCILHQDDFFLPGKLARHVELMDGDPTIGFSYSAQWFVGPAGEPLSRLRSPLRRADYVVEGRDELRHLGVQNYLNYCNVVMRRTTLESVLTFENPNWVSADWGVWLRLALRYRVGYVDKVLVCYRIHPEAQTLARSHDPDVWGDQLWHVVEELYTSPELPQSIASRRALTEANQHLSIGLLRLLRRDWRGGRRSLARAARLAGRRLPSVIYSSAVVPRAGSRLKMMVRRRLDPDAGDGASSGAEAGVAALRCGVCGAISGYPLWRPVRRAPAATRRFRCLACGARWSA